MKQKEKKIDTPATKDKKENKRSPQAQLMRLESIGLNIGMYVLSLVIGVVVSLVFFFTNYFNGFSIEENRNISIALGALFFVFFLIYWKSEKESKKAQLKREIAENDINNVTTSKEEDIFENSFQLNHKYLKLYYAQTAEHAEKGFQLARNVSACGAIIAAAGIIAMFAGEVNAAYVTTACGVIAEFISAVFFSLYNKTVRSMGTYHNKLVLSQNIALALKIADSLSDTVKDDVKRDIINELIKDANHFFVEDPDDQHSK